MMVNLYFERNKKIYYLTRESLDANQEGLIIRFNLTLPYDSYLLHAQ